MLFNKNGLKLVIILQERFDSSQDQTNKTCRLCQYWTHVMTYSFSKCFSFLAAFTACLLLDSTILTNHKGLIDPGICHQPESHNFHLDVRV